MVTLFDLSAVAVKPPTLGGGNYDVATFKMDEPFSDDKLKNVK